jgi:hypothetical protein
MARGIAFVALITFFAVSVADAEITAPIRYTWIVESCETWNCAVAALVMADGEPNVIVLPTGHDNRPWLILRRVEEGSLYIPETEPFGCEVFENIAGASSRFSALDGCHAPMILNVPDGRAVVVSMHKCDSAAKRRAVR